MEGPLAGTTHSLRPLLVVDANVAKWKPVGGRKWLINGFPAALQGVLVNRR